jgi:hypothetical protein
MSGALTKDAETLRQEIKQLIASAEKGDNIYGVDRLEARDGRVVYMGDLLGRKISALMQILKIKSVCFLTLIASWVDLIYG